MRSTNRILRNRRKKEGRKGDMTTPTPIQEAEPVATIAPLPLEVAEAEEDAAEAEVSAVVVAEEEMVVEEEAGGSKAEVQGPTIHVHCMEELTLGVNVLTINGVPNSAQLAHKAAIISIKMIEAVLLPSLVMSVPKAVCFTIKTGRQRTPVKLLQGPKGGIRTTGTTTKDGGLPLTGDIVGSCNKEMLLSLHFEMKKMSWSSLMTRRTSC